MTETRESTESTEGTATAGNARTGEDAENTHAMNADTVNTAHATDPSATGGLTLVLCGNGKNGRRVADRLSALGRPVRVGSRGGEPSFDWEAPNTWGPALHGVRAVFVVCQPDVGAPGTAESVREFAALAARSGVRRLVLLTARGEDLALPTERAVREAGTEWTLLRASWFAQNFSEGVFLPYVLGGELPFPAGDVPEPFVDADDLADVAVAALTGEGHHGQVYDLTGPRALTYAEACAEIAKASGRVVRFAPVTGEWYAGELAARGLPPGVVAFLGELFAQLLDGRNTQVSDDVRRVLGRPARDFADVVREAAATGAWREPA